MGQFLKVLGIILLTLGVLVGFYFASIAMGPTRDFFGTSRSSQQRVTLTEAQVAEKVAVVERLEAEFSTAIRVRAPDEQDLELIREAIALQQEIIDGSPSFDASLRDRLDQLTRLYHDQAAGALMEESERLEQLSIKAEVSGVFDQAMEQLTDSVALQRQINEQFRLSRHVSLLRQSTLERRISSLTAKPVFTESQAAEAAARAALTSENWNAAAEHFAEAIRLQQRLNRDPALAAFANVTRLSRLEADLASLESRDLADQIATLEREARLQMEAEAFRSAAERFFLAARLQSQLNQEYPQSRFAGIRFTSELEKQAEAARSVALALEIVQEMEQVDALLRRGATLDAMADIGKLLRRVQVFRESFPTNPRVTPDLLAKLEYLNFIRSEVGFYQKRVGDQLLPIPGSTDGAAMLSTEVSQALFSRINGNNPSRVTGETLPVESLTYEEAMSFCRRLGWIFGRNVRLPRRDEFERAVGSLRYVNLLNHTWNRENSGDQVKPVGTRIANEAGFYDLLGNVQEWVQPSGFLTSGEAFFAGGSVTDSVDRLAEIPFTIESQRARSRTTGFRVVVEGYFQPQETASSGGPPSTTGRDFPQRP